LNKSLRAVLGGAMLRVSGFDELEAELEEDELGGPWR
jgi:hypothetical protein